MERRRGKPNRGGGRGNRGRGNRGAPREGRGAFSRKGTEGYDLHYSDDDDGFHPNSARPDNVRSGSMQARARGYSRPYGVKRKPVKVEMQKLNMTTENQVMVREMLHELHGAACDDVYVSDEEECDELDVRTESQYWLTDNKLNVEDAIQGGNILSEFVPNVADDEIDINPLSVLRMMRYGFQKETCWEALQLHDGDIGMSLEYILQNRFGVYDSTNASSETETNCDFIEQRQEEMIALCSIYEDKFSERITNRVWNLKISLPHLYQLYKTGSFRGSSDAKTSPKQGDAEICKFFLKGHCRFGRRCRCSHVVPDDIIIEKADDSHLTSVENEIFEVDIRFPVGNRYPCEPPLLAFSATADHFPKYMCLVISDYLYNEAKKLSETSEPVIFTLVNLLEDKTVIEELERKSFASSSFPPPVISREKKTDQEPPSDIEVTVYKNRDVDSKDAYMARLLERATNKMLGMVDKEESSREASRHSSVVDRTKRKGKDSLLKSSPSSEILKQNRRLKDDFNRKVKSKAYLSMQEVRQKLPAWQYQEDICTTIEENQVVVISGMTGCGKTTQVPQFILDSYLKADNLNLCNIVCTQPRRISAMSVADRVADERAEKLGHSVGYQIRLETVQSPLTRVLFCTTGIILRRLEGDPELKDVTHLIIDEVHERSMESDFLIMILRKLLSHRKDLRVILMSATLNAELFSQYFGGCPLLEIPGKTYPVEQYFLEDIIEWTGFVMDSLSPYARPLKTMNAALHGKNINVTAEMELDVELEHASSLNVGTPAKNSVQDQNLSFKQFFLRYSDYSKKTVKAMSLMDPDKINYDLLLELLEWIVLGEHEFPENGAILIFLPGFAEIQNLFEMLQTHHEFGRNNRSKYKIIPLHSTLSSEDQHAVFRKPREGVTKIVIATNIAETSITIDDIIYVIDSGKMKEKRYDPTKGMESLDMVWVTRANALQRKGRAGRVTSGVCFHLFTGHRFQHNLRDQPIPEIQRAPLEQIVLRIKMLELFKKRSVEEVLTSLLEPPAEEAISGAVKRLQDLGALDMCEELTPLGYHLGSLPVDVRIGKLMLFGAIFRCLDAALTIAATLSFKSPFVTPFGKKEEATKMRLEFAVGNSDHLTMLNAYKGSIILNSHSLLQYLICKGWLEAKCKGHHEAYQFCQDNFLSTKTLQMLASLKQQFVELLSDIGFVRSGLSLRDVERASGRGSDGVLEATGPEANCNSKNWRLVAAILVGALYPNIVQVLTPEARYSQSSSGVVLQPPKPEEIKFKTKVDGYINIHPSSVNFQVRYYESPYLVFHEKIKTSKVFVRDCTMVSVYPLLLFGGGSISIDLDRGNFIMSVDDGWIRFAAESHDVAALVRELRMELDHLLADKIKKPDMNLCTCPRGSKIIDTIVKLITTQ